MPQNLPKAKPGIASIAPYVGGKSKAAPGIKAVKLSSNETPLGPSPAAIKAYIEAAQMLHRYPDGNSTLLRDAIAEIHNLPAERIICGAGSDELIAMLVHAYAGEGDEVLYPEHGFLMYKIYAQSFGATPVTAPEKSLRTDVDALLAAVTPRTKIVFVANPNNPTGSYISASEMKRLRDALPSHIILAIDGAYAEYASLPSPSGRGQGERLSSVRLPHPSPPPEGEGVYTDGTDLAASTPNTIMLRTFSKIYGLSALRIGWAYGPPAIIDVMNRIRGPFNLSGPGIATGIAAIRDTAFTNAARAFNAKWLTWLSKELAALGLTVHPSIANFLLVEFSADQSKAANAALMAQGLIVREVANYGLPNCLRISVGLEEDNKAVVATLAAFLKA